MMEAFDDFRIPADQLSRACSTQDDLGFCRTMQDIPPLEGVIGQERAVRSMQFGLDMSVQGYNIFVVGPPGTGKSTYVDAIVKHVAEKGDVPDDWCYIYNFQDRDNPLAIALPAGRGRVLVRDMDELVSDLRLAIPKAFESSDYELQKDEIVQEAQAQMQAAFQQIEQEAREAGFSLKQVPGKFLFVPLKENKSLSSEAFKQLPEEEQRAYEERGRRLEKKLEETLNAGRMLEKQAKTRILDLEKKITRLAAEPLVRKLIEQYQDNAMLVSYLQAVLEDVAGNHVTFKQEETPAEQNVVSLAPASDTEDSFLRYKVNLFVNHEKTKGVPVVIEPFPNYYSLFGKIEYRSQLMAMTTNFTMARSGALHKANGGYLVLQARDVLLEPFVWDTLKRVLKYGSIAVENIGEQYRYVPIATMRMEAIPLNVKVILIGSPLLYYILSTDEDFQKLFKVKVEFDVEMVRNADTQCKYASFIRSICEREHLLPFSQDGLIRMIDHGSRLAGSQNKLSTRFNEVRELVYEAHALASKENASSVASVHVSRAIQERKYRNNRVEEKIQEMIAQGKILIDVKGTVIGQINGLSIISLGSYTFGQPSRITAVTYLGKGGVINIERETKMSGQIHDKGVLILSGYLGSRFAQRFPLSLTAQITFEQNYEGVDGDSASCAELCAILSSLADLPIRQGLAMTGSVNQLGRMQPIGGVTEKVEGFFDVCRSAGLTGEQGVIVPVQNVDNLMLKDEVVEAVRQGIFHVYAVRCVEEAIEMLTGLPAGACDQEGLYPGDTVFGRVARKLLDYQERLQALDHGTLWA